MLSGVRSKKNCKAHFQTFFCFVYSKADGKALKNLEKKFKELSL